MSSIQIVAYIALFVGGGALFVFANLLIGKLVRPSLPHDEKLEIYECGEPTIGSSFVQFDLRFYVVALLFLIFDVEVAFFFPWATVYGKATHLKDPALVKVENGQLTPAAQGLYRELGVPADALPRGENLTNAAIEQQASQLALFSFLDIAAFFAIVLVGFAYVWWRGDIDWVRAVSRDEAQRRRVPPAEPAEEPQEPALV